MPFIKLRNGLRILKALGLDRKSRKGKQRENNSEKQTPSSTNTKKTWGVKSILLLVCLMSSTTSIVWGQQTDTATSESTRTADSLDHTLTNLEVLVLSHRDCKEQLSAMHKVVTQQKKVIRLMRKEGEITEELEQSCIARLNNLETRRTFDFKDMGIAVVVGVVVWELLR